MDGIFYLFIQHYFYFIFYFQTHKNQVIFVCVFFKFYLFLNLFNFIFKNRHPNCCMKRKRVSRVMFIRLQSLCGKSSLINCLTLVYQITRYFFILFTFTFHFILLINSFLFLIISHFYFEQLFIGYFRSD